MSRKKPPPQEFKTNESILSILTIIKVKKNTSTQSSIYQDLFQRFFRPLKSGKKLRWEAYSNFHQRLLQRTWGRVNYGNRSSVWRQNAWLWSTSLKVKYDWENCFCPKKPKVKKAEKRRWCWDALFLTDFSCRLQAEHDGYLPWNNWIKLLYQKWLWFSNPIAPNFFIEFWTEFEARKSWEKSVEKKVFLLMMQ